MKRNQNVSKSRRRLLKRFATLPFLGSLTITSIATNRVSGKRKLLSEEEMVSLKQLYSKMPKGKLGDIEISRLVMGCNPMGGWSHARDLRYVGQLSRMWHTDQKIKETFAMAELVGINTTNLVANQYRVFNEYKNETNSNMLSICQCSLGNRDSEDPYAPVKQAIDLGFNAIYIHGENTDRLVQNNQTDVIQKAIEIIRAAGLPAGIGAHALNSILVTINDGIKPDFYYKTFHHDIYWSAHPRENRQEYPGRRSIDHNQYCDNIWDVFPEKTIKAFQSIDVPFFGFKVLAAGAIPPADGIKYAFENGADFVCIGMYDFQMVENADTTMKILGSLGKRDRPWYA